MRACSILAGVKIPVVNFFLHTAIVDFFEQLFVAFLTNRTANDFANAWEEYVGALHSLSVFVLLHIERLNLTWVVGHNYWAFEVFFHQVAFVLAAQVHSPFSYRELEFNTIFLCFLQYFKAFCVGKAHESIFQNTFEASNKFLVNHLVEELKVVLTVLQCPTNTIFNEVFFQVHQFLLVDKSHFGFYHPELCQVSWRIRVFCTERRTECIDSSERCCTEFAFQLSRYGKMGFLAKEVSTVIHFVRFCHTV